MAFDGAAERLERDDAERAAGWGAMTADQLRRRIRSLDDHPYRVSFGRILAGAVLRHAGHLAPLLPPEWLTEEA